MRRRAVMIVGAAVFCVGTVRGADFALAGPDRAAPFVVDPGCDRAVGRAADDVRHDIERVCGRLPDRRSDLSAALPEAVLVGVVGQSAWLDDLSRAGKLDLKPLRAAWETFVLAIVDAPRPGIGRALVVAGSDRRGAIYGLYEISHRIGVSPWTWWADVPTPRRAVLTWPEGSEVIGPPSVKYRGLFINDEDWGLQPWAAHTFDPATGNIGPKTYAKVFELLLRLRGNLLWPAMHPTTQPFNRDPANRELADAYGIVMGSSHAEPMLRNNVGEWTAPPHDYNYVTNRDGVLKYWEQRVAENGRFENIYTLGMRGIHDSLMVGPKTDAERVAVLEQIFADQRALLARHVRPEVEQIPQMFCAYKEVLGLYRLGLKVPPDVTIVWPDDNFGYVAGFASAAERQRPGGFGVYYHLSYLGRPLSYLWLSTTPPALIWQQMHQAYENGADRIWVANVGDIKPAEIPTEFFLQLAWNVRRWNPDNLPQFLEQWAAREFGAENARRIAAVMARYYLLNFQRRPEHLQWWLKGEPRRPSEFTDEEVRDRLAAFASLRAETEAIGRTVPVAARDAFSELVYYPVVGSALANERCFLGERGELAGARAADAALVEATRRYNEETAGGKWRGILSLEPADDQWASMRIERWAPFDPARTPRASPPPGSYVAIDAAEFQQSIAAGERAWKVIPGLGRSGRGVTVLPSDAAAVERTAIATAPRLDYAVRAPGAGEFTLELQLLPTHPRAGTLLHLAVAVDDEPARVVSLDVDGENKAWSRGVLAAVRRLAVPVRFTASGPHTLRIYGIEAGVVLDRLILDFGAGQPTYLGPDEGSREKSSEEK